MMVGLLLASATLTAADTDASRHAVAFSSQSRVQVDAGGNVVDVQTDPKLPASIAEALGARIREWKFAPPSVAGKPVGGVTYVRVDACAAPSAGAGLALAFEYRANGPLLKDRSTPIYPMHEVSRAQEGSFKVTYRVDPDGRGVVEEITPARADIKGGKGFKVAIRDWIRSSRYEPELVDGKPAATRVSQRVDFVIGDDDYAKQRRLEMVESESCQVALGHLARKDRLIAVESHFRRLPAN